MKNRKNIFLSVLLGCLVLVTAIAGVVTMSVKNNDGEELEETIDETMEEYLWGDVAETKEQETNTVEVLDAEPVTEAESIQTQLEEIQPVTEENVPDNMEANLPEETVPAPVETLEAAPVAGSEVISLVFSEGSRLKWPVQGSVILEYSMDTTVYFSTLKQYKCNPGILIQSEPGAAVVCPANALVNEVGYNDEIGGYVSMSLGNGYEIICGQLTDISVCEGDYVNAGDTIGVTAEPTSCYVVEGCNIYLELRKDDVTVDPLDFME